MRYLLAVVMVLVFCVTASAGVTSLGSIGRYKSTEKIIVPLSKAWDTSATGTTPRFRYGVSTWNKPDSAHIVCRRASGTAGSIGTHTYKGTSTSWPFNAINVDTSLSPYAGDTLYWLMDSVGRLNGGTTIGCLACQVALYYKGSQAATFFTLNVDADSTIGNRTVTRSFDGAGGQTLKLDSILVAGKFRRGTDTIFTKTFNKDWRADSIVLAGKFARGTDSANRVVWYNGSDTCWSVTSAGSGKPAVAFRNTHATGAAGSNGFYVSSANREAGKFAATSSSSVGAYGLSLTSASSGGVGFYIQNSNGGSSVYSDATAYSGEGFPVGYMYDGSIRALSIATDGINSTNLASTAAKEIRDSVLNYNIITKAKVTSGVSTTSCVASALTWATDSIPPGQIIVFYYGTAINQSAWITKQTKTAANVDSFTFTPPLLRAPAVNDSFYVWNLGRGLGFGPARAVNDSNVMLATDGVNVSSITDGTITTADFAAGAINSTVAPNLDASVNAVKLKTDNLPASPANEASVTKVRDSVSKLHFSGDSVVAIDPIRTVAATVAGGATEVTAQKAVDSIHAVHLKVEAVRDTAHIIDSIVKAMSPILTQARDSINAISTWLDPTLDSLLYASGFKQGARSIQGVSNDCDTLHVKIGTTEWFKMLFYHVGGTPGARPDSTITVAP